MKKTGDDCTKGNSIRKNFIIYKWHCDYLRMMSQRHKVSESHALRAILDNHSIQMGKDMPRYELRLKEIERRTHSGRDSK